MQFFEWWAVRSQWLLKDKIQIKFIFYFYTHLSGKNSKGTDAKLKIKLEKINRTLFEKLLKLHSYIPWHSLFRSNWSYFSPLSSLFILKNQSLKHNSPLRLIIIPFICWCMPDPLASHLSTAHNLAQRFSVTFHYGDYSITLALTLQSFFFVRCDQ